MQILILEFHVPVNQFRSAQNEKVQWARKQSGQCAQELPGV